MKLELTEGEIKSPLWVRLEEHLNDRLSRLRESNDKPTLSEIDTARLRGKVAMLKELIALGNPKAPPEPD